ncbi:ribosomal protein s5 (apicoplast) [Cystoisospora suis]|uniref:Ribosomal protein s5 n=1 Tax=Cystoisospora suis TaxID=483139 RepID=A0A2C6LEV1_9APIC|nr:ribosomal protein s5 [Cystoisospora suis]
MIFIKKTFYILNFNKLAKRINKFKNFNSFNITQIYNLLFYLYILKDFIFYKYFFFKTKIYWILINIFLFLFNINFLKFLEVIKNKFFSFIFKIKKNLYLYYIYIIKILLIFNYNLFFLFFYKKNKYNKIFQKIIEIKKISKTKKKGRIKRFKVLLLIGSKNYWIGIGVAKDFYLQEAINKARFFAFKKIYFFYIILEKIFIYSNIINKIKCVVTYKSLGFNIKSSFLIQTFLDLIGYKNLIIKIYKNITKYYFINFFIKILLDLTN